MRILIVEDESDLRQQLKDQLNAQNYSVDSASDGEEGLYLGKEYPFDLAVIDLGLPKLSGIELIQKLRKCGHSWPILILTARGNWQDKVEGLEAGADDYVVKPFHIEELLARINALLRRAAGHPSPVLKYGPLELNTSNQTVTMHDADINLTSYEYRVLEYLLVHRGEVVSKTTLTEHIYDQDFDRDSNVLEVFIGRLRRKLDKDGHYKFIETKRGQGYRFNPESLK